MVKKIVEKKAKWQAKKIAPKRPVRKKKDVKTPAKSEKALSKKEIEYFRQLLLKKMHEIVGNVNSIEDEALKKSHLDASGDLSSMPIHMADIGTDNYEQEFALNLLDSERKLLRDIVKALKRIDNGVYGICEITETLISRARLEAKPWAKYCIEYARLVEKGVITEGEPVPESVEI